MSREGALLLMIGVAVVLLGVLTWAWMRRVRRDAGLPAPVGELPSGARELARFPGLYVATTRHDQPLERLAIRGLGFRSRAEIIVTDAGVALDLPGQPRMLLPAGRLVDAALATVAIDRVVERDGLVRVSWRIDDDTVVDTFLRPQDASARSLADAIRPLLPTGSDA
ncbi:PH-like domain-containing protein [Microbacterium sp. RD1]|uniref:PH-like domain-containing protein n=1 Tax=Microbacterium sp. RD1 TaxID=3457313 RepID=UPI003FA60425